MSDLPPPASLHWTPPADLYVRGVTTRNTTRCQIQEIRRTHTYYCYLLCAIRGAPGCKMPELQLGCFIFHAWRWHLITNCVNHVELRLTWTRVTVIFTFQSQENLVKSVWLQDNSGWCRLTNERDRGNHSVQNCDWFGRIAGTGVDEDPATTTPCC